MPALLKAVNSMSLSESVPRIAVIGAQGIGKFHAGLFKRLGADVEAICCSSQETAQQCAEELKRDYGIVAAPHHRVEDVLALELDGVSLCTPPHLHYEHLLACLDKGVPVFCEKPLFWNENDSLEGVKQKLALLRKHPQRRIFVNTSNTHFLDVARTALPYMGLPSSLQFSFFTQGPYTSTGIAFDLFPHALSFVLHLFGERSISSFTARCDEKRFACSFEYGDAHISFDLREDPHGPKDLFFSLDKRQFGRVQEGFGPSYRVFLEDVQKATRIEVDDPFKVFLAHFVEYLRSGAPVAQDSFMLDAANLELMASLLLGTQKP